MILLGFMIVPTEGTGQGLSWFSWAASSGPTQTFSPEMYEDYLLTGHTPHPAVVRIVAPEAGGTSLGSGVLVDVNRSQGLVITNWHVVRDSRSAVLVQFPDGFQSAGTVARFDQSWDLALLVIWRPDIDPVPIADTPAAIGEQLTIAGYGRGPYRESTGVCTQFLAPSPGLPLEMLELVATARQGDSGGPIFNARGQIAGILFGQQGGHTAGTNSIRVRSFLASVGSTGVSGIPKVQPSNSMAIAQRPTDPRLTPPSALALEPPGVSSKSTSRFPSAEILSTTAGIPATTSPSFTAVNPIPEESQSIEKILEEDHGAPLPVRNATTTRHNAVHQEHTPDTIDSGNLFAPETEEKNSSLFSFLNRSSSLMDDAQNIMAIIGAASLAFFGLKALLGRSRETA